MTFVESLNSFFDFVELIDKETLFYTIVFFITIMYIWENYLSIRQIRVERNSIELPRELVGVTDKETFEKSRLYAIDKGVYDLVHGLFSMAESYAIIFLGFIPFLWKLSAAQLKSTGVEWLDADIPRSMLFVFYFMVYSELLSLPWSFYYTFVLEEKHGFNKQTVPFFIKDNIKKFLVSHALTQPILALLIYIIQIGGDYFFIYAWLFTTIVALFLITIYADFIAPLFDKFEPLQEGELRTRIEELAKSLNFPLYKLYVLVGSRRSAHSNAYMYGFYKNKRIVIFDTLIEGYKSLEQKKKEEEETLKAAANPQAEEKKTEETNEKKNQSKGCNNEEIVAVLAHELGHWKLNHNVKNLIMTELNTLLYFMIFAALMNRQVFYSAFGFDSERPVLIGLIIIVQLIFAPYNELVSFVMTYISRMFEFQADEFAMRLGKRDYLKSSLIKLHKDNLSFPIADWLYSMWHYSHPPLLERLRALNEYSDSSAADKKTE